MSEAIYDSEIAPLLMQAGKVCEVHGIALVATTEYAPGEFGSTYACPSGRSLAMILCECADKAHGNIDSLVIGFARYCNQNGIDTKASIVLTRLAAP